VAANRVVEVDKDYDFWTTDHFESVEYPRLHFVEHRYADDPTNWWIPNRSCAEGCCGAPALSSPPIRSPRSISAVAQAPAAGWRGLSGEEKRGMIEAAKIWNEPNNKSHWDLEIDPGWTKFAEMAVLAGKAIHASTCLTRVLAAFAD